MLNPTTECRLLAQPSIEYQTDAMNTILIVISAVAVLWIIETVTPNNRLPVVKGWYGRCALLNGVQALIAWLGAITWDSWFSNWHMVSLSHLPTAHQVLLGYLLITFIYSWWHRARHAVPLLWRGLHQTHHSASRLEVITSFYKHPAEVLINGLLSSAILYLLLGLTPTAAALTVLITGLAELFYHMNLRTPHWLGYVFQRPEMHRIHHQRGVHRSNYSDLPIWDMLFGTFSNPRRIDVQVGFPHAGERRLGALLRGRRIES